MPNESTDIPQNGSNQSVTLKAIIEALEEYKTKRATRSPNPYISTFGSIGIVKSIYTLFGGHRYSYSKDEKFEAVEALIVRLTETTFFLDKKHHGALRQGELGKLIRKYKINLDALSNANNIDSSKTPPLLDAAPDILCYIANLAGPKATVNFTKTCKHTRNSLATLNEEKAYIALLQAVLDGNTKMVKKILDGRPERLKFLLKKPDTTNPNKQIILTTKSWREILIDVCPFELIFKAWQLPQPEMIELMLSYIEELESTRMITNAKKIALEQWKAPVTNPQREEGYKNFQTLLQQLMDAISNETFPKGLDGDFSAETEGLLTQFRELTSPDGVMRLEDYFVGEQELQDAYDLYVKNYDKWNTNQCIAFCIKVIGWLQRFVSPRTAMVFCTGLYDVVENGKKITPEALAFILSDGKATPFYPDSRLSLSGLGGKYLICRGGRHGWIAVGGARRFLRFENYVKQIHSRASHLKDGYSQGIVMNQNPSNNRFF